MLMPEGLNPGSYTPFTADNKLNEKVLASELERVVPGSGGLHGPAGHSEFASLTFDEWKAWLTVMIDVAHRHKLPAWCFFGAESFAGIQVAPKSLLRCMALTSPQPLHA